MTREAPEPREADTVEIPLRERAFDLAIGDGSVWVYAEQDGLNRYLYRIHGGKNRVTGRVRLADSSSFSPRAVSAISYGEASVWVAISVDSETTFNPSSGSVFDVATTEELLRIEPGSLRMTSMARFEGNTVRMAVGAGSVWLLDKKEAAVRRFDIARRRIVATISVRGREESEGTVFDLAFGEGALWVSRGYTSVLRVDPKTNRVSRVIRVDGAFVGLAVGEDGVWVPDLQTSLLYRIDPESNGVESFVSVPGPRAALFAEVGAATVWVANSGNESVARVDLRTRRVVDVIWAGESGWPMTSYGVDETGSLWFLGGPGVLHITP